MERTLKWLWLTNLSRMYSEKITLLLDRFDTIDDIYAAKREDFSDIDNITKADIDRLCDKSLEKAEEIYRKTDAVGGHIIDFDSELYPERLKRIATPPYVLYVRGNLEVIKNTITVGVVGTREYSLYGEKVTKDICSELAENGLCIVSGMARGIDTISATAALKAGGKTVAVLGCGVDIVYPPENGKLMDLIIKNGAVVSEYPPMSQPYPSHFPERNRIIAGLSDCLLVTEAPAKSGSLITARYAYEMGRHIFSVPGSVYKINCVGTNNLIKAGAIPVTMTKDIFDVYAIELKNIEKPQKPEFIDIDYPVRKEEKQEGKDIFSPDLRKPKKKKSVDDEEFSSLSADEKVILKEIIKSGQLSVDEIIRATKMDAQSVNSKLPLMEIMGIIKKLPGNLYTVLED